MAAVPSKGVQLRTVKPPPLLQVSPLLEESVALARYASLHGCASRREGLLFLPAEQRARELSSFHAANIEASLQAQGKCGRCMFKHKYCICKCLADLEKAVGGLRVGERVRFLVWMHLKERKRASNTGKLLEHILPGSEVFLNDVPEDAERFRGVVAAAAAAGRAFVLYPSEDAISASEMLARAARGGAGGAGGPAGTSDPGAAPGAAPEPLPEPLPPWTMVLIDGTWRQAHRMHKQLEGMTHVGLETTMQSEFHWRRQSIEGRISTVEAAALLLQELGERPDGVPSALRRALAELNGALERQCHYDTIHNGKPLPEPTSMRKAGTKLGHKMPKTAPGMRSQGCAIPFEPPRGDGGDGA